MSLFGKKKKETKVSACCGNEAFSGSEAAETKETNACYGKTVEGICCLKVLGSGCKSCHEQYENTKRAVKNMGLDLEVEYITDMEQVMNYGVMSMPAIVVNEQVASMGKVLKASDVEHLLNKLGI